MRESFSLTSTLAIRLLLSVPLVLLLPHPAHGDANRAQLEAIGSLAAAHVFTSYGYIGVTADAFVEDTFTAEQVGELMTEVVNMLDINIRALRKIQESVGEEDGTFITNLVEIYELVKQQARALVAYAKSREPEDAQAFEKARTAVWPKLQWLLGIE